jgi:hypothetical protein
MNAVAIQYIWQAIRESEQSDDLSFIDARNRSTRQRIDRFATLERTSFTAAPIDPLPTPGASLPAV